MPHRKWDMHIKTQKKHVESRYCLDSYQHTWNEEGQVMMEMFVVGRSKVNKVLPCDFYFSLGWGQNLLRLSGIQLGRWFREGVRISVGKEMEDFCFRERHIGLLSSNGNSTEVKDQELVVTPICVVVYTLLLFFISLQKPGQKKKCCDLFNFEILWGTAYKENQGIQCQEKWLTNRMHGTGWELRK